MVPVDEDRVLDVAIVGAGISGSAIARELSRNKLHIEVFEAGYDVACGCSRTNSGIVHGGYDPVPGTLKAKYNVAGAKLIPQLAKEIGFHYRNNSSMVVAYSEEEVEHVKKLVERGHQNGVEHVRYVDHDELRSLEPNVSSEAMGALLCEDSGIVDPFGMTVAFAENAVTNGVTFHFETRVAKVEREGELWALELEGGERVLARAVVNAAGVHAIELHNMVSADQLPARPRIGEYVLLDREMGEAFNHTMFQTPNALGKGILVSPTVEGNIIVGPDALDTDDPEDTATRPEGLANVIRQARKTWPELNTRAIITNFAGVRPTGGTTGDFVLGQPEDAPGFFDVAAFDSPGLSSAPAMAIDLAADVAAYLNAEPNPDFDGHRDLPLRFEDMTEEERVAAIENDPLFARIVCRCEHVSEAEVLATIHAPIPATTIVGVKRRCRAGTGRCQGGFCEPLVAEIIARELGIGINEVRLAGPGSEVAPFLRGEVRHERA